MTTMTTITMDANQFDDLVDMITTVIKLEVRSQLVKTVKDRGPKNKISFNIYENKQFKDQVVGGNNVVKYVNKNFNFNINSNSVINFTRRFNLDETNPCKIKSYNYYNGVEIERI